MNDEGSGTGIQRYFSLLLIRYTRIGSGISVYNDGTNGFLMLWSTPTNAKGQHLIGQSYQISHIENSVFYLMIASDLQTPSMRHLDLLLMVMMRYDPVASYISLWRNEFFTTYLLPCYAISYPLK